ncbi:hypothetical protein [Mycobacteroides abscessus]|uniref:hypothetical protein n=1 Tax=Mycobacteroides abscessus TaxID=36809 RepID=UPI002330BF03|nr:hypothetical protein [Mycobacteroides abscessus]MDB2196299.1 hypothetical protein [Mycobacteroides abscessus subsp. abscessus]MDB2199894.1 hypothetical protein [Mycobacteroides abscessus subsp. abscessus]
MLNTYSRGHVTLTIDEPANAEQVVFTITRTGELTDNEISRVNAELADHAASRGAQLLRSQTRALEVRSEVLLASDGGEWTSPLRWTARL